MTPDDRMLMLDLVTALDAHKIFPCKDGGRHLYTLIEYVHSNPSVHPYGTFMRNVQGSRGGEIDTRLGLLLLSLAGEALLPGPRRCLQMSGRTRELKPMYRKNNRLGCQLLA